MSFSLRLLMIAAALVFLTLVAAERPRNANAKARAERGGSSLCVGAVPAASSGSRFTVSKLLTLGLRITAQLPWDSLFSSPVKGASVHDATGISPSIPFIGGLPENNAPPPARLSVVPAQTVSVSVGNNFFSPETVQITAGDTVQWTWGGSPHTVTSGACCTANGGFCSPFDTDCDSSAPSGFGEVYSHTFNAPGTFPYFCRIHGGRMTGTVVVNPAQVGTTVQFDAANYNVTEGCVAAIITVTRSGDTSGTTTVDFVSSDSSALQRSDYSIASGTVSFATGQTSRTFKVLTTEDAYVESNETLNLTLSNVAGATLGIQSTATVTIADNDTVNPPTTQPIDDTPTFVCQHYHDFLSREPDTSGFEFWKSQITQCGSDEACIRTQRITVSNAFFYEQEYQQTGSYVVRVYRAAYGNNQPISNNDANPQFPNENKKLVNYSVFSTDRARVRGGPSLAQTQLELANAFVLRPQFIAKYPSSLDGPAFVDAILDTISNDIGVNLTSQRTALIDLYNQGGRGKVLYRLADDNASNPIANQAFLDAEYNRAFVLTQYFGYLRRNPDVGGFVFWLGQVNGAPLRSLDKQRAMVCSFITSAEYQQRFSSVVTRTNNDCPQ